MANRVLVSKAILEKYGYIKDTFAAFHHRGGSPVFPKDSSNSQSAAM